MTQSFNSHELVMDPVPPTVSPGKEMFNIRCDPQGVSDYLYFTVQNPAFIGVYVANKFDKQEVQLCTDTELSQEIVDVCEKIRQHCSKKWKFGKRVDYKNPIFRKRINVKFPKDGVEVHQQNGKIVKMDLDAVNKILSPQGRVQPQIQSAVVLVRAWGKYYGTPQESDEEDGIHFGIYFTLESLNLTTSE